MKLFFLLLLWIIFPPTLSYVSVEPRAETPAKRPSEEGGFASQPSVPNHLKIGFFSFVVRVFARHSSTPPIQIHSPDRALRKCMVTSSDQIFPPKDFFPPFGILVSNQPFPPDELQKYPPYYEKPQGRFSLCAFFFLPNLQRTTSFSSLSGGDGWISRL